MNLKRKRDDYPQEKSFANLCPQCGPAFSTLENLRLFAKGELKRDLDGIVRSAESGCALCRVTVESLGPETIQRYRGDPTDITIKSLSSALNEEPDAEYPFKKISAFEVCIPGSGKKLSGNSRKWICPGATEGLDRFVCPLLTLIHKPNADRSMN